MIQLTDIFKELRRLDLKHQDVQDSLYRISDWLEDEQHSIEDTYIQNQLKFLNTLILKAKEEGTYYFTL